MRAPASAQTAGLKLVYTPLNGSGLVPVTHVLKDIGITDVDRRARAGEAGRQFPHLPVPQPRDLRGPAPGPGAGKEVRALT